MIKRILTIAAICLVFVLFAGLSSPAEEVQGKDLYMQKCQLCHGKDGDGKGSAATFLGSKPADFTDAKFWKDHSEKDISEVILNGKGEMPAFDMPSGEIKALVSYLSHFKK